MSAHRQTPWVTVIGRGHSGTRAIARTLVESGVFMGEPLNGSSDLIPAQAMYDACRVMAPYVDWQGGTEWSWQRCHEEPIPDPFIQLIENYLSSIRRSQNPLTGWKIPETTLVYPWIRRMFPEMKTIFWVRDPRDCILGKHLTDDLSRFGIPCDNTEDIYERRALSWIYQYKLVRATPPPAHWIEVRLEDFVLDQEATLARLEKFLGIKLAKIPVKAEAVGRYRREQSPPYFGFLDEALRDFDYPPHAGSNGQGGSF